MAQHRRKRRVWKTFYLSSSFDFRLLKGAWQLWPRSNPKHEMHFEAPAVVETNVPLGELRKIFRQADVKWIDYVSSAERAKDQV